MKLKVGSLVDDAARWRTLAAYMERWPYSPYTDLEYRALRDRLAIISKSAPELYRAGPMQDTSATRYGEDFRDAMTERLGELNEAVDTLRQFEAQRRARTELKRRAMMTPFEKLLERAGNDARDGANRVIEERRNAR